MTNVVKLGVFSHDNLQSAWRTAKLAWLSAFFMELGRKAGTNDNSLGLCARIHNMRAFIRHPSDIPIEIFPEQQVTHATQRLTNVSIGGLCYRSDTFFEIGLLVRVRISLIRPPFEAKSRVVWCLKRDTGFDVGLQFIETRDIYKVRMVEQICHIEHYKKRVFREEGRVLSGEEAALEWLSKYDCEFPDLESPNSR